jgi:hypothetical protein
MNKNADIKFSAHDALQIFSLDYLLLFPIWELNIYNLLNILWAITLLKSDVDDTYFHDLDSKYSLEIPEGQSEVVNRRIQWPLFLV